MPAHRATLSNSCFVQMLGFSGRLNSNISWSCQGLPLPFLLAHHYDGLPFLAKAVGTKAVHASLGACSAFLLADFDFLEITGYF